MTISKIVITDAMNRDIFEFTSTEDNGIDVSRIDGNCTAVIIRDKKCTVDPNTIKIDFCDVCLNLYDTDSHISRQYIIKTLCRLDNKYVEKFELKDIVGKYNDYTYLFLNTTEVIYNEVDLTGQAVIL